MAASAAVKIRYCCETSSCLARALLPKMPPANADKTTARRATERNRELRIVTIVTDEVTHPQRLPGLDRRRVVLTIRQGWGPPAARLWLIMPVRTGGRFPVNSTARFTRTCLMLGSIGMP